MTKIRSLISMFSKSKVVHNGIWLYFLEAVNTFLPLVTIPYITRILSATGYGEFSLALNWIGYLEVLVIYGFNLSATRKMAVLNDVAEESRVFSCILLARGFLCAVSALAMGVIWLVSPLSHQAKIAMLILFILVIGMALRANWIFQAKEDMKLIAILSVVARGISTALCFLLVKSEADLYLYCFLYATTPIIAGVAGVIIVKRKYGICFRWQPLRDVLGEIKDGWYTFISAVTTKLFGGFGLTCLGFMATAEQAGVYAAIHKISLVMTLMWSPISQVCYPYLSKVFGKSWDEGINLAKKVGTIVVIGFATLGICFILLNKPLVWILFGEGYVEHSMLMLPMIFVVVEGIVNNFLGVQILTGSGHAKEYSKAFLTNAIGFVLLTLVLGHYFSMYGIAYAYAISELCLTILLAIQVKKVSKKQITIQEDQEK